MTVSNLRSITIAGVTIQSGHGEPDHAAPVGTSYTNLYTGDVWQYDLAHPTFWRSPWERLLQYLGFSKINMSAAVLPAGSSLLLGEDLDGKLKIKDAGGYIFEVLYS
jgi:hypothetical protein